MAQTFRFHTSTHHRLTISERALVLARFKELQARDPKTNGYRAMRWAGLVSSLVCGHWGNSRHGKRLMGYRAGAALRDHPIEGPRLMARSYALASKGRLKRAMNLKAAGKPYLKLLASVDRKPVRPIDQADPPALTVRHPRKAKSNDNVQF